MKRKENAGEKNSQTGNKAYRFRIEPNAEQKILFAKTFGCVRFIYNRMLADKIEHYKKTKSMLNTTPAQYKGEFEWLKEVDSLALANAQQNLQRAYGNFFRNPAVGFPRFQSKKEHRDSYTTNNQKETVALKGGYLRLPKVGNVRIRQHREVPEEYRLKSATITKTPSGKYYASILYEYELPRNPERKEAEAVVGLDYSLESFYVDSNGKRNGYPGSYRACQKKLAWEQRKLSHMEKGSKNREKQRIRIARLHEKISNQRKDFLHKESRQITNAWDCVCIEDLDLKEMAGKEHHGKSVSDTGWGMFTTFLSYKLQEAGKRLIRVDRYYPSSQLCSACGYQNQETKDVSVRTWICPGCGANHDRDWNAAKNIRKEGIRLMKKELA